jgi:ribosome-associated protein
VTEAKPSKSARKRMYLELQKLGEALIPLRDSELEPMDLDEKLLDAIRAARSMRSHGALRRQKQLIGKLMQGADAEAIRAVLAARDATGVVDKQRFARAEHWRDRLLSGGSDAFEQFVEETGEDDAELRGLLAALADTHVEREEKNLRRRVFRRVHSLLDRCHPAAPRPPAQKSG